MAPVIELRAPAPPRAPVATPWPAGAAAVPVAEPVAAVGGRRARARLVVGLLLLGLAAGLRLWSLGTPATTVWDEHYYVFDGSNLLGGPSGQPGQHRPRYTIEGEGTWQHPPLAKILIGIGEGPLPDSAWGWRWPAALFGTLAVGLTYLLGLELMGSVGWAGLAGLAVALDGLEIVQSRIATLDVFLATFALLGVYLTVRDLRRTSPRSAAGRTARIFGGPERLLAGLAFGAAVACKWDGVFLLALSAGACLVADRRAGRRAARDLARWAAAFLAAPLAVYLASYAWFWAEHGPQVAGWLALQWDMLAYHRHFRADQMQSSRPWVWPILTHPIRYWSTAAGAGRPGAGGAEVMALGNPGLWWGYLAAAPVLFGLALRRGRRAERFVLGAYLVSLLPWMLVTREQFFYYLLPAVPFMALGLVMAVRRMPGRWARAGACLVGAAIVFWAAVLMPVWLGVPGGPGWARHVAVLSSWT